MSLERAVEHSRALVIRQRKELAELFGFETRNKYAIETEEGQQVGWAAEQQKGFLGALFRQMVGHWRSFELHIFDADRTPVLVAHHPFRWFFQRLEVTTAAGRFIGAIQQRFGIITKRFELTDAHGRTILHMRAPIWRIWTFPFFRGEKQVAVIEKKWSGLLKEAFTDADNFRVDFGDGGLEGEERLLVLAAGLFVDLQYFENKAEMDSE